MGAITLFDAWLSSHQTLVVSIGVPLLTLLVTNMSSHYQDRRANERQVFERKLQKLLKISEFRQKWIDDFRTDLAELISYTVNPDHIETEHTRAFNACMARIQMRINPADVDATDLKKALYDLRLAKQNDGGEVQSDLTRIGQKFLKKEWDRLRRDLDEVEKTGAVP